MKPWQFCNLSAVVAREEDDFNSLREKIEIATIIGTIQSTATDFPGLRAEWKRNCEEERLLGVDVTGQMDCPEFRDSENTKEALKEWAVEVNEIYADLLGINHSASVTAVKPSGNSSVLLNCSNGIHARYAPYYFRHITLSAFSPIYAVLKESGVPLFKANGQENLPDEQVTTWIARFPMKSPEQSVTREHQTVINQCDYWLQNKVYYTEHNPSTTISYRENEVIELAQWVYEHQDYIGGMAFLPYFVPDETMRLLPYVEITREEYEEAMREFPTSLPWYMLTELEKDKDMTTASQELACLAAGGCEV